MDTDVLDSRTGRIAYRASSAVALLALLAFGAHALFNLGGSESDRFFGLWVLNLAVAIAFGLCLARAISTKSDRGAWISMSLAIGVWLVGSIYANASGDAFDMRPDVSLADFLYVAFLPAGAIALGLLVRSRVRPFQPSMILDGLIVALAITSLGSAFLHQVATSGQDVPGLGLRLGFPLADLMLLAFVGWVLALIGWRASHVWDLIVGGLTLAGIGSALYLVQLATGDYQPGSLPQLLWPAAMLLIAAAAWRPLEEPVKPRVEGYSKLVVASASSVAALGLLIVDHFVALDWTTMVLAATTIVALIARATVTFKENLEMLSDFRHEAQTDSLTGLGNRRKLLTDLARELGRASVQSPRMLLIFDLDGFKRYNDTYGHPAGDTLLQRLGGNLARAIGPYGHGYRLGGDEFCVLVTSAGASAKTIISITAAALTEHGEGFSVTASYGVVMLPHEARSPSLALKIADQRMYTHKEDRRSSATRQTRDILMQVLHEREPELGEHMMDVAKLARGVGVRMGLHSDELDEVIRAAELHDVGKMAIPDEILHKPATLDDSEWEFIRQHTIIGERILKAAPSLLPVAKIVRASHERFDGAGYPDKLAGERIPLGARIVSVCDAFDAMTTSRPYREAMETEVALSELSKHAGTQFDPRVVEAVCQEIRANGYHLGVGRIRGLAA